MVTFSQIEECGLHKIQECMLHWTKIASVNGKEHNGSQNQQNKAAFI